MTDMPVIRYHAGPHCTVQVDPDDLPTGFVPSLLGDLWASLQTHDDQNIFIEGAYIPEPSLAAHGGGAVLTHDNQEIITGD